MKPYNFDVAKETKSIINWIKEWFKENGPDCNAVIGMSGGKDSTIVAKLLVDSLGKDRVIGVALPDKNQGLNGADEICRWLGIDFYIFSIENSVKSITDSMRLLSPSRQTVQNIPPRIRMTTLYAVSQSLNGRVVNTCNLSEDWVGYSTRYGDNAGDFSPLSFYTVTEILQIGDYLGIPSEWVHKIPDDGLPNSSPDEKKFGFTYAELDKYIREGIIPNGDAPKWEDSYEMIPKKDKIDRMHKMNLFKTQYMACYHNNLPTI